MTKMDLWLLMLSTKSFSEVLMVGRMLDQIQLGRLLHSIMQWTSCGRLVSRSIAGFLSFTWGSDPIGSPRNAHYTFACTILFLE